MSAPFDANQPAGEATRPAAAGRLTLRAARTEDAPRLAVINVDAWRQAYRGIVPATYLESLDVATMGERWQLRLVALPDSRSSMVAEIDGVVAAYAFGGRYRTQQDAPADEDTTGWGELFAIYTLPSLERRGAGGAVHDAILAALSRSGFTQAALWVLRDNIRSIAWYANRGWRPDGSTSIWSGAGVPLPEIRLVRALA